MGIFDDAIREHLDLKRRQGADESELQQLEDEAFGPPARPGDPDFPETGESQVAVEDVPAEAEAPEAADEAVVEPSDEAPPHGDALLADPEAEPEPAPADEGPVEDTGASSFSTTEREAIASKPTEYFEQAPEPLDMDELDLDLKDELDEDGDLEDEEPVEEEEPVGEATPVHEHEVAEEAEPREELDHEDLEAEPDEGEDAEDVLEETPEFLRDNPDDDELWFEQGKPKDFDF